jgi:CheY-like chemotaxis protein
MRLVALTTLGDPEDRANSAKAGFNVHLVKPVRPGKVRDTIRTLLAA